MSFDLIRRGGIWYYTGTVDGKRIRRSARTSEKDIAKRIAAEAYTLAWQRRLDGPEAALRFAACALAYRRAGKPTRFLEKVEDHWKNTLRRDITPEKVRRAAVRVYPTAGPATRNRHFIVPTQAIINHAAELGWCAPIKVTRFKVETKIKTPVTGAWAEAFAAAASPHLGALCLFMYGTGARIGEAVALRWGDVDLGQRTARIRQTKVGNERIAHLQPRLMAALANIPSNRNPADPVFKYARRDNVRQVWENAVERAAIPRLTPHCCRHGFATTMLQAGIDVKTVAQMGGWKDAATLVRTYAHAMTDRTVTNLIFDTELAQPEKAKDAK